MQYLSCKIGTVVDYGPQKEKALHNCCERRNQELYAFIHNATPYNIYTSVVCITQLGLCELFAYRPVWHLHAYMCMF